MKKRKGRNGTPVAQDERCAAERERLKLPQPINGERPRVEAGGRRVVLGTTRIYTPRADGPGFETNGFLGRH